jgi:hypothetical protein
LSKSATAGEPPTTFDELIAPLEQLAGQRLNGVHRRNAHAAYAMHPEGVARCVAIALERGRENPIGLFVTLLAQGVHLEAPPPAPETRSPLLVLTECIGPCGLKKACRLVDGEPWCADCLGARG